MTDIRTENDAVIQIAQEAARAESDGVLLELGKVYAFPTSNGPEVLDLGKDAYLDRLPTPQRKHGTTVVEDVSSFLTYYAKHADTSSEVFVDVDARRITAILDAHSSDGPRWGQHRLILQLKCTRSWNEWLANDRKPLSQRDWAEFVEDHLDDIREPPAAEMLEIASTFQAKTKVTFASATRLPTGDATLVWEETTDATAGAKANLKVPTQFKIAVKCLELPIVEGEDPVVYGIDARFRYRIDRGALVVSYLLDDPQAKLRDAVLAVVKQVEEDLNVQVLRGAPASA